MKNSMRLFPRVKQHAAPVDYKAQAILLWETDPCGGDVDVAEGTPEFYKAVDRSRYLEYAPWLKATMDFSNYGGKRVLEIGCGMGTDLAQFARAGAETIGLDLTPRHLEIAQRRFALEGFRLRFVRGDGEQLPLSDQSVDAVYSFGVLHHTPDIEAAVRELHRVLRAGGTATIGLYHRNSSFYWAYTLLTLGIVHRQLFTKGYRRLLADIERHEHSDALPLVRVYSRRQLRRLLSAFSSVEIVVRHFDPPFASRVFRRLPRSLLRWCDHHVGWYIIAKARK